MFGGAVAEQAEQVNDAVHDKAETLEASLAERSGTYRAARAGQSGAIISGIVIAAALLIGIFVISQINDSIPTISNNQLSSARDDTVGITGDAMQLGAVVVLVIFASVILRVLQGL